VCVMVVGPFASLRGSLSPQTSHGNMTKGDAAGSATVASTWLGKNMSRLIRENHGVSGVEAFRGRGFIVVPQDGRSLHLPESDA
jgi:hypothetical protein